MTIRISDPGRKVAVITAATLAILLVSLTLTFAFTFAVGAVVALAMSMVLVLFCGRTFRGPSEDASAPRSWWRFTERPMAGYILGALFAVQAISYLLQTGGGATVELRALGFVAAGSIAAAFLNSSVRLTRALRTPRSR